MAEYHYSLRAAVWEIPLTSAFALSAARADRLGIDLPGHADAAAAAARDRVKAWFSKNYQII